MFLNLKLHEKQFDNYRQKKLKEECGNNPYKGLSVQEYTYINIVCVSSYQQTIGTVSSVLGVGQRQIMHNSIEDSPKISASRNLPA